MKLNLNIVFNRRSAWRKRSNGKQIFKRSYLIENAIIYAKHRKTFGAIRRLERFPVYECSVVGRVPHVSIHYVERALDFQLETTRCTLEQKT